MDIKLLTTKLFVPPVRSELVSRPRLIDRLQKSIKGRVTLISAPAGFGKTTLINAWSVNLEQPVVWLSLDDMDNDLARFLAYFVASLQKVDKDIGLGVQKALQLSELPSVESLMTALINDIIAAECGSFVQVLDDYHVIQERSIHEAMTFLLENQPPQMHLIIATREEPPLPLSRLEAQGQASILRARDLHFNAGETSTFLNDLMKLDLSDYHYTRRV